MHELQTEYWRHLQVKDNGIIVCPYFDNQSQDSFLLYHSEYRQAITHQYISLWTYNTQNTKHNYHGPY